MNTAAYSNNLTSPVLQSTFNDILKLTPLNQNEALAVLFKCLESLKMKLDTEIELLGLIEKFTTKNINLNEDGTIWLDFHQPPTSNTYSNSKDWAPLNFSSSQILSSYLI